ncbi:MAG: radical SAM protein [Lachnospiraceae bacterium]|nr:radical SAM protein [Lachnospiraceae bacterium]
MASLSHNMQRKAFGTAIDVALKRLNKNREKGYLQVLDLAQRFMGDNFKQETYDNIRAMIQDPENKWLRFTNKMLDELDPHVAKMTILNLGFEAALYGTKVTRAKRKEYQCNIPWLILMDPTSACNLRCTGCWAAEYGYKMNLTYDEMDSIVTQGKELGVYFYMFTGGEPLVRKADLLKLAKKHNDCEFHSFTNGTLIDEEFCKEVQKLGNFSFSLSLEGFEEANDGRRGEGAFQKTLAAMDLMKKYGLFFGTSVCYTRKNMDAVTSDGFFDLMIEHGCRYAWYFHYMPVGHEADVDLLPTMEQREYIHNRIREVRGWEGGKQIMLLDFQNDGEFVGGCIAGGRNYFHINANGDAEPCVFIHYSGANIRENTLLECLQQPLFMAYRDGQPFNENHLRPCPMLENPEKLQEMVHKSGAHSTDLQAPESVEHLCGKCEDYAKDWAPYAEKIWNEKHFAKKGYTNYKDTI